MTALFWFDCAAYGLSTVIAMALALIVLGTAPRRALNRIFAFFALSESIWAISSLLLRMSLWLEIGRPLFFLELATFCFALIGPFLLAFTTRYVGRHTLHWDMAATAGVLATAILGIPLFQHQILFSPRLATNGSVLYAVSNRGYGSALVPTLFLTASVILFWRERHQSNEWLLILSTLFLLLGFLSGGVFSLPLPILSITTTFNAVVLGYVIITQQLLNPLRELTTKLERKVEQRTEELQQAYSEVEKRVQERTVELRREIAERAQAEAALRRRNRELATLYETVTTINSDLSLQTVLQRIAEQMAQALDSSGCALSLWDRDRNALEVLVDYHVSDPGKTESPGTIFKLADFPATRQVLERQTPLVVQHDDPTAHPTELAYLQRYGIFTLIMLPLCAREEVVGLLELINDNEPRIYTEEEMRLAESLAAQAAIAIRNAQLYEKARRRADRLSVVNHVARAVGATLQLDALIEAVYQQITPIFAPDACFLALYDAAANELDFRLQVDAGIRLSPERQDGDTGLTSAIVATKEPLLIRDFQQEQDDLPLPVHWGTQQPVLSWLGVPMQSGNQLIGVLCIQSYDSHAYDEEDQLLLSTIAEQVAVAVERARLYQTIRNSEERYRTLFEEANDAVFLETMDGRILDVNERACELLGYTRQELLRLTLGDIVPDEIAAALPEIVEQLEKNRGLRMETENLRRDGSRVAVEVSLAPLEVGQENLILAIVRDVSERKQMEEQLRSAQKMEAIGTLAGGVAHDFNNILTGVLGYASLVRQELPPDSALCADIETIINSAQRGMDLTRQLLALAHYRQQVERQAVDLNAIAREVVRLLSRTIDRAISIQLDLHDDLGAVEGDAGQLHQMVLNLCLNARDAMPQGGQLILHTHNEDLPAGDPRLKKGIAAGPYVVLRVTDTGSGMEAAVRERIFEPFFSTKERGRGLGMAMVYGTVRSHGGAITVDSEPGHGTTITVYLPAHAAPVPTPQGLEHPTPGGVETVLVVDDEEYVRGFLKRGLERSGYNVLLAQDGLEALQIYRRQGEAIDLVILDMIMPRLSGRETFQQLLEIDPQARVLLSSGYSENSQTTGLPETDHQGFLQKPYDLETVQRKVRHMLDA